MRWWKEQVDCDELYRLFATMYYIEIKHTKRFAPIVRSNYRSVSLIAAHELYSGVCFWSLPPLGFESVLSPRTDNLRDYIQSCIVMCELCSDWIKYFRWGEHTTKWMCYIGSRKRLSAAGCTDESVSDDFHLDEKLSQQRKFHLR